MTACSLISGRSTDGSRVSSHATASATSAARIAYISNGTSCSISVSTGPGVTMWTLMPSRSTSCASAPANAFMPAFDAEYAVLARIGSWAAEEEMNTKREPAFIRGSAADVTTKHESRLAEMVARHWSKVCLRAYVPPRIPDACTRRSISPAASTAGANFSGSVASATT